VLRLRPRRRGALLSSLVAVALPLLVVLELGVPARAAYTPSGQFPGLGSGRLWSLAVNPGNGSVVIAGTDNGVYRSGDGGATWSPTSLRGVRAWVVGFDARDQHTAFAGLDGRGVARSSDGSTWTDSSSGLTDMTVRSLAFGLEGIAAGTRSGVDVSADGSKWRSAGLDGYSVSAVAVSANQPQLTIVAGVDGMPSGAQGSGFLFRNSGGGQQWETLQQGLPAQTFVSSVAAGPLPATGQPRPLLVTTSKGVYHSGDGGTTWTSSTGVPDQTNLTVTAYSPLDPNLVYAGADAGGSSGGVLMRSTDSGASFTAVADALPDGRRNVDALAVGAATPPVVLVGVNPPNGAATVFRGQDAGAPTPAGTGQEAAGAALSSATPTPKATARPRIEATRPPQIHTESTGIRHVLEVVVRFPFPLTLELLFILLIVYLVLRWRQRYLDVEGPP
jgi:hypothetical protein